MTPNDHLDTSAVRRVPTPTASTGGAREPEGRGSGRDVSRIIVLGFVLLFLVGGLAFLARALTAVEADGASAAPSASTLVPLSADAATDSVTDAVAAPVSPLPSTAPCPSPLASAPASPAALSPEPTDADATPDPTSVAMPGSPSPAPTVVDPCADATASVSTAAVRVRDMPFVPVVRFWQARETISGDALRQALRGRGGATWSKVLIPEGDRGALESALGISIPKSVREASPEAIVRAVKRGNALGILRASDVVPSVRALGIGGRQLFGNERVSGIGRWPLVARVAVADDDVWRQSDAWTLVAGGDSFTDRGIYERVAARGKGVDYPFDGGTARVTGHHICPSCPRAEGNSVPIYKLSGPKGIVRDLVKDADLAIANHEQPTPTNWRYHLYGLVFSGKPDLTRIFTRAGIDFLSLANNHIRDYGEAGLLNTLKTLDRYGIRHTGAGKNAKAAAKPAYLKVKGVTVGIVACNQFSVARVGATRKRAGALTCKSDEAFAAIREARKKADVLIVFPHWGIEYTRNRKPYQERLAARWERMGVDLVIGSHSHVPGGIGDIDGMPVFYSLGNFIFDQSWSTATTEGILAEMTFQGDRLVQMRIHPFLTHDQAQPNLLNPARDDGKALINEIRKASKKISDW